MEDTASEQEKAELGQKMADSLKRERDTLIAKVPPLPPPALLPPRSSNSSHILPPSASFQPHLPGPHLPVLPRNLHDLVFAFSQLSFQIDTLQRNEDSLQSLIKDLKQTAEGLSRERSELRERVCLIYLMFNFFQNLCPCERKYFLLFAFRRFVISLWRFNRSVCLKLSIIKATNVILNSHQTHN